MIPLVFHVWQSYLFSANAYEDSPAIHHHFTLTLYTCVYIQDNNAHEVLHWQFQIFYICKPYLFFHDYNPFSIPYLAVIFVLCKCLWRFSCHSSPFHIEIVHTCVYIQDNNAHEILHWQLQIFYICKPHLFLHIYDSFSIPCLAVIIFFYKGLWNFIAIHKHFTFGRHIFP